ncbi:xanthine dehydrogenase family protein molybdopterin-binding subunit [Elongatibacter sediminis]|uniref:Xanthine dehydrogenase family protein molybdopterin-binding subunit n=1 Tax=Elongatibacter sediminis TaxID=3119006 RepID=A0AAW9R9F5_9GAMM
MNSDSASLYRKEDARLVRGAGLFTDDEVGPGLLHVHLVRSPYAHARIQAIDTTAAEAMPGVVCTLTGAEIAEQCDPYMQIAPPPADAITDYPMAVDRVRYQGEPVVAVVAETAALAADAGERVEVEYDVLPAVIDVEDALTDTTVLHDTAGTNRIWREVFEYGEVDRAFEEADHVIEIGRLHFHRFASTPLETNACVAEWTRRGKVEILCNNSFIGFAQQLLAPGLRLGTDQLHIRSHDIGGSFGNKIWNYLYMAIAALASRKAGGRRVKWSETRSENLLASGHGNERTFLDTEVAVSKDGVITGIRSRHLDDCGAYPRYEPLGCIIWAQVLPATYGLRNVRFEFEQAVTNKCPVVPNRGYSRMQHIWFMERVVDVCAHTLGIPLDVIRERNYIREFPYETPNGCIYDSGDYLGMLDRAKELIGWDEWKRKQAEAKAEGRRIGIGIGATLDSGTNNFGQARIINPHLPFSGNSEVCTMAVTLDGTVRVTLGTGPSGQSHETAAANLVAREFNIPADAIYVQPGFDTAWNTFAGHSGTYASQFAVTGMTAIQGACDKLKAEMRQLAAHALEAAEGDLEFATGEQGPEVRVRGTDQSLPYWMLSNLVNNNNASLDDSLKDVSLNVRNVFRPEFEVPDLERKFGNLTLTYAALLHIVVVEIDPDTCRPKILAYAAVDDCGTVLNPKIVEGQAYGGTAHGIGASLMEQFPYDAEGNLLTTTFSDYCPITAMNMPDVAHANIESPSPFTYNGAKGMGESAGAPLHAISGAIQDALWDEEIVITDSYHAAPAMHEILGQPNRDRVVKVKR